MSAPRHLLMIHGLLGSIDYFSPQRHLAGVKVHTPDLLGYGARAATPAASIDLPGQAAMLARYIDEHIGHAVWLLGHSVGGAVAMLVAELAPHRVAGLISVEGNFTLNDAFWCARIAAMSEPEWAEEYRVLASDPTAFLLRSGITADPQRLDWAARILSNQPHGTVHGMARSVIRTTGDASYLRRVEMLVERGLPVHLLAGERSAGGWDVPAWVRAAARSSVVLPGTGHMMMLEEPATFCQAVHAMMATPLPWPRR